MIKITDSELEDGNELSCWRMDVVIISWELICTKTYFTFDFNNLLNCLEIN